MEIPTSVVYVGKGVVSLAKLDSAGVQTTPHRPIGNVPGIGIKQNVTKGSHKESMSGLNVKDAEWVEEVEVNLTLEVDNFDKKTYELFTSGTLTAKSNVTPVTGKTLPGGTNLAVGDRFDLGAMNVSAVTLKDSTGTPKTLTLNTNYKLDTETGVITIIDLSTGGPFVGPLKADYTPGLYDEIKGMTTPGGYFSLMFEGLNQVTNKKEKRILGKVSLPPASEIPFISNEPATATIEGTVLKDVNGDMFTINLLP